MKIKTNIKQVGIAALAVALVSSGAAVYADSDNTNLSQQIGAGTITTFVGDTNGDVVSSPNVAFSNRSVSNEEQTSTGTYGTASERIYVDNPGGANGGWTLVFAGSSAGATWTSGGDTYAFNGATASDGQLTVDPRASGDGGTAAITALVGGTTGLTQPSTTSTFSAGGNTPVSLITASGSAADIAQLYLTGVGLSQTIPASQPAGSYTIQFVQTVTAS